MKSLFIQMKNLIFFTLFLILSSLSAFAQPPEYIWLEAPCPEPCPICKIPYHKGPKDNYGNTCFCNHDDDCPYSENKKEQQPNVTRPNVQPVQTETTEEMMSRIMLEEIKSYLLTPQPEKTPADIEAEKQKLEAERLEKEKQARIAAENQRLINEQKAREHQELQENIKHLDGGGTDLEMKGLDNTPPPKENILAQSLIFQNCLGDNIEIKRNGVWTKANCTSKSEMITVGETIRTGPNSSLQLTMLNLENKIQINANSEFVYDVKNEEISLDLLYGKVRSTLKKKLAKKFVVRTGGGTASVRGTDFETIVYEDGSTEFVLYEGKIEITPTGSESIIILQAGQKIRIYLGGKIVGPVLLDAELNEPK